MDVFESSSLHIDFYYRKQESVRGGIGKSLLTELICYPKHPIRRWIQTNGVPLQVSDRLFHWTLIHFPAVAIVRLLSHLMKFVQSEPYISASAIGLKVVRSSIGCSTEAKILAKKARIVMERVEQVPMKENVEPRIREKKVPPCWKSRTADRWNGERKQEGTGAE